MWPEHRSPHVPTGQSSSLNLRWEPKISLSPKIQQFGRDDTGGSLWEAPFSTENRWLNDQLLVLGVEWERFRGQAWKWKFRKWQRDTESLQCTSSKVRVKISQLSRVGITLILRILVALLCVNSLQDNILYRAECQTCDSRCAGSLDP